MPDPVTGRWKPPRLEQTEGPTQCVKDPPEQEDHLPQTPKKRAESVTATSVETDPSHGILDELAERLGNFHDSARTLACCLQKHDVSRKTDQSMIEAARWMFHKLLGRHKGRLGSIDTAVTRRSLHRDQAEQTTTFSDRDIERESWLSSRGAE